MLAYLFVEFLGLVLHILSFLSRVILFLSPKEDPGKWFYCWCWYDPITLPSGGKKNMFDTSWRVTSVWPQKNLLLIPEEVEAQISLEQSYWLIPYPSSRSAFAPFPERFPTQVYGSMIDWSTAPRHVAFLPGIHSYDIRMLTALYWFLYTVTFPLFPKSENHSNDGFTMDSYNLD